MKAAVLEEWKKIVTKQVNPPQLQDGEAVIRVGLAGICGSDIHIFNGKNPIAVTPVIPGHEFMGEVVEANGPLPDGVKIGGRVVVHPLVSCGTCAACVRDLPHVCEKLIVIGVNRNGGFAELVSVPTARLIAVPDGMPDEIAALTEPFAVGYHACSRAGLVPGEKVLINGCGPIGLYAAIVAQKLGASDVVISEPHKERRALGEHFGFVTVDPSDDACLEQLKHLSDNNGYNVVIETSGVNNGINLAIEAAAVQGRIASLGFPAENYAQYNVTRGIVKELSFIGSRVYPIQEFRETLHLLNALCLEGKIDFTKIIEGVYELEDLSDSIINMADGKVNGKILIRPN